MQKLNINEIFYSIQGEGGQTGLPMLFIRLAGCNLNCHFCDTEYNEIKHKMDWLELHEFIKKEYSDIKIKDILWTGGEPTLQLTDKIVNYFGFYYRQSIETNGMNPIPYGIDYKSVSPKNNEVSYSGKIIDELRYPIKCNDPLPEINHIAKRYYLSPINSSKKLIYKNVKYAMKLIKGNQTDINWQLSIQLHKLIGIK